MFVKPRTYNINNTSPFGKCYGTLKIKDEYKKNNLFHLYQN